MKSNYEHLPLSEPKLITSREAALLKVHFERTVIDPLFFGNHDSTIGQVTKVQERIDDVSAKFQSWMRDNFEVSNEYELSSN